MPSRMDRALGAFCLAFAAFFVVAGRSGETGGTFAGITTLVTLAIALLAAVPGIWLLVKGRSV